MGFMGDKFDDFSIFANISALNWDRALNLKFRLEKSLKKCKN